MRSYKHFIPTFVTALVYGMNVGVFDSAAVAQQDPNFLPNPPAIGQRIQPSAEPLFPPSPEEMDQETDLQRAERELRDFLVQNPDNEEAIIRLGLVILKAGRTQEAIDYFYQQHVQSPANPKIAVGLGRALLESQQNSAALDMFYTASMYDPNLPDINYWIGLAQLKLGTPLAAYHTLLNGTNSSTDFTSAQQLLRGTSLASMGLQSEASDEYMGVMQQGGDGQLQQRARELQSEMDQSLCSPSRFRGFFKVGMRYDDNPGIVPTTNAFGAPVSPTPSAGNSYAGQVMYDVYRGYNRNVVAGYTMYGTTNYQANSFNLLDNAGFVAMSQRGLLTNELPYLAGLRFDSDYLTVGGNPYLGRFGVTPSFTVTDSDYTSTSFLYRYLLLNFFDQGIPSGTFYDKNSSDNAVGVFRQRQNQARTLTMMGGYMFDNNQSVGGAYNYNGNQIQAGVTWLMPVANMQLNALQTFYFRDYTSVPRNDVEYVTQLLLLYPLQNNRWFLTFGWLHDDNQSNLAAASYRRNVLEVGLQYNFGQGAIVTPMTPVAPTPMAPGLLNQRTTY